MHSWKNYYAIITSPLSFKVAFQNVDQPTVGKWLIYNTKHHKDNQLQSLEPPYRLS